MKIIGHTAYGYIIEASVGEVGTLCAKDARAYHGHGPGLPVGTQIEVHETFKTLSKIERDADAIAGIANTLRATATLIESIPHPLTLPASDTPTSA